MKVKEDVGEDWVDKEGLQKGIARVIPVKDIRRSTVFTTFVS